VATTVSEAVDEIRTSYGVLSGAPLGRWLTLDANDDRAAYAEAYSTLDWAQIAATAQERMQSWEALAQELLDHREAVVAQWTVNQDAAAVLDADFVAPSSRPDWTDVKSAVEAELTKRGDSPAAVARAIATLAALRSDGLTRPHRFALVARNHELDGLAARVFAGEAGARLAACVARFNQAASAPAASTDPAQVLATASEAVDTAEDQLWQSLQGDAFPASFGSGPDVLDQAVDAAAAVALQREAAPADPQLGALAVSLGTLTRRLLLHASLRRRLEWIATDVAGSTVQHRWLQAARLPRPTAWAPPEAQPIETLADGPDAVPPGTRVSVAGLVGPVVIEHHGGVASSHTTLSDANGKSILVATRHRKLDSSGMVGGSYASVVGEWHPAASASGQPSLHLVRRRYLDLARQSWTDWVAEQLRASYEASPQGLATEWSWQPGSDGAGNQLRYAVWFAKGRRLERGG
jgi:hypothetical protein